MSTDKKELWLIVSPTECKRVHELKKPDRAKYYTHFDYCDDLAAWEEAERTLSIHPDCLEIKEGDTFYDSNYPESWFTCVVHKGDSILSYHGHVIDHDLADCTKYPLNSIWHGEEREGKIWLTEPAPDWDSLRDLGLDEPFIQD